MAYQVQQSEIKNIITGKVTGVSFQVRRADGSLFVDLTDEARARRVCQALNSGESEESVSWSC